MILSAAGDGVVEIDGDAVYLAANGALDEPDFEIEIDKLSPAELSKLRAIERKAEDLFSQIRVLGQQVFEMLPSC